MSGRKVPHFKTDEEAEAFLEQDLSDLDLSQFKPSIFVFKPKMTRVSLRVSQTFRGAVKIKSKARGIPYTRYIRQLLEHDISGR